MQLSDSSKLFRKSLLLLLFLSALSSVHAEERLRVGVQQASHFCRLFVNDGERIMPLSAHARRVIEPNDSLTQEQLFTEFILRDDNWQSLRIFPHPADNQQVVWYAAGEDLPANLGAEHQKYIREVFPRLISEAEAGNWQAVDAYIDRMLQYQSTFAQTQKASVPMWPMAIGALLSFVFLFLISKVSKRLFRSSSL